MKHVTHWIDGALYVAPPAEPAPDGVGGALTTLIDRAVDIIDPQRTGDLHDPATGQVTGTVDFASVRIVDEAVEGGLRRVGAHLADPAHPGDVRLQGAAQRTQG